MPVYLTSINLCNAWIQILYLRVRYMNIWKIGPQEFQTFPGNILISPLPSDMTIHYSPKLSSSILSVGCRLPRFGYHDWASDVCGGLLWTQLNVAWCCCTACIVITVHPTLRRVDLQLSWSIGMMLFFTKPGIQLGFQFRHEHGLSVPGWQRAVPHSWLYGLPAHFRY